MSIFSRSLKALSILLSLVLCLAYVLPVNARISSKTPALLFSTQALINNAQSEAGLNGAEMEYAIMPTTFWTSLLTHLPSGNLIARAELFDFPGAGITMTLGLTYNALHKDIDLGLGKGWMSDLHTSAVRDPLTNTIRYVSPTGTLFEFVYSPIENKYLNPLGFSGQVIYHSNGSISIIDLDLQSQTFNSQGQLIEVKKCGGGSYTVSYDNDGQAVSMTDPASQRSITLEWSPSGILESIKDPMDNEWKLSYSQDYQQLVSLEQPEVPDSDPAKTFFEYNSQNLLISQSTFKGYDITLNYHTSGYSSGKISQWSDPNANETSFDYSDASPNYASKTTLSNAEGHSTQYFIGNTSGQIERINQTLDQEVMESTFSYDSFAWLSSVTDPQGGVYQITRNASGKITSFTYPPASPGQASFAEEWIYDSPLIDGKLIQYKEKLSSSLWASTYYFYEDQDAVCLASKMVHPDGSVELTDYNTLGQPLSITLDPNGLQRTLQNTYAQNGNLTLRIDPEGNESTYQHNANGLRVLESHFQGSSTLGQIQKSISTVRLFNGYPIEIGENLSNSISGYIWSLDGPLVCMLETDDCGEVCYDYENSSYNKLPIFTVHHRNPWSGAYIPVPPQQPGLLDPTPPFIPPPYKITHNDSQDLIYSYDKTGKVTEMINPLGQSTQYSYDTLGRKISEVAYDGQSTSYTYDKLNEVVSKSVSGEGTWTYTRDALGRTTMLQHPFKGLIQYSYSLRGDLLSDEKGSYSYDMMGRKVSAQYSGGGNDQWSYRIDGNLASKNGVLFEHNKLGMLTKWSDGINQATIQYRSSVDLPLSITGSGNFSSYAFQYDNQLRMTQVQDSSKQVGAFSYLWNAQNRLQSLSSPGQIVQENSYNQNKLAQSTLKKGSNVLYSSTSSFNNELQRSAFSYTQAPSYQESYSFVHDSLKRLQSITSSSNNRSVNYAYDQNHGKVSSIQFSDLGTYVLTRNTQGFIQSVGHPDLSSESYTYNTKGLIESISLPANRNLAFSWDSKNRISQIQAQEMMDQTSYSFNYNAIGMLSTLSKSVQGFAVESWQFVNGPKGLEHASRTNMGFPDLSLDFSRDLLGRVLSISYAQMGGFNGEIFPHFDYLGNLTQITDLGGNLLASFQYDIINNKRIQEWNPQQLQLPFNGYNCGFQIDLPFSGSIHHISLPDNGKLVIGADWGIISPTYDLLGGLEDYESFISWDCLCGDWAQGKGKMDEKDREAVKRELRRRGFKEKDLDRMVDEIEYEINGCCTTETDDGKGGYKKGEHATLVFGEAGEEGWWIRCKIFPEKE
jgi:YD repeat-containing protein